MKFTIRTRLALSVVAVSFFTQAFQSKAWADELMEIKLKPQEVHKIDLGPDGKKWDPIAGIYYTPENGPITTTSADGTQMYISHGQTVTKAPDGTTEMEVDLPYTVRYIEHPDGTREWIHRDGSRTTVKPDGTEVLITENGRTITTTPEGNVSSSNGSGAARVEQPSTATQPAQNTYVPRNYSPTPLPQDTRHPFGDRWLPGTGSALFAPQHEQYSPYGPRPTFENVSAPMASQHNSNSMAGFVTLGQRRVSPWAR